MASVYIIYSDSTQKFYTGCTSEDVTLRLHRHNNGYYDNKYTAGGIPWTSFLEIQCQSMTQAMQVEKHIKSMKSRIYIENLKRYPEMIIKLIEKYS